MVVRLIPSTCPIYSAFYILTTPINRTLGSSPIHLDLLPENKRLYPLCAPQYITQLVACFKNSHFSADKERPNQSQIVLTQNLADVLLCNHMLLVPCMLLYLSGSPSSPALFPSLVLTSHQHFPFSSSFLMFALPFHVLLSPSSRAVSNEYPTDQPIKTIYPTPC